MNFRLRTQNIWIKIFGCSFRRIQISRQLLWPEVISNPVQHQCKRLSSMALSVRTLRTSSLNSDSASSQGPDTILANGSIVDLYDDMVLRGEIQVDEEQRNLLVVLADLHRSLARKRIAAIRRDAMERWIPESLNGVWSLDCIIPTEGLIVIPVVYQQYAAIQLQFDERHLHLWRRRNREVYAHGLVL